MTNSDLIILVVGILVSIGGFVATIIVGILSWLIRRLIKSVDDLKEANEEIILTIKDRPTWSEAGHEMNKVAEHKITVHERDHHPITK